MAKRVFSEAMDGPSREESLSSLMKGALSSEMTTRLNATQRATAAWFAANGDRERAHTTRVFLKESNRTSAPIICVMVDSHALVSDFLANRDLYLARLANQGYAVSGIEFLVDRSAKRVAKKNTHGNVDEQKAARSLTAEQLEWVESLVQGLDEPLRSSVSKAVINSILSE